MPTIYNDLWTFASTCYAQPGVESACLELQAAGADVCLILTGAWLECRGVRSCELRLKALIHISESWQSRVVAPLRELRNTWKQPAALDAALTQLRDDLKRLEQSAEKIQLERLQSTTLDWPTGTGTARWLERLCPGLNLPDGAVVTLRQAAAQLAPAD